MVKEKIIFENLLFNEQYNRKVIPFIQKEYFSFEKDKVLFELIQEYFTKYNNFPSKEALEIELGNLTLSQSVFDEVSNTIEELSGDDKKDLDWLMFQTESFCQNKALHNALSKSIEIYKEEDKENLTKGAIPKLLSDALAVSFDTSIGHDWLEAASERWEYYHQRQKRVQFDIDLLNKITGGGLISGTLNIILAGTGIGKTTVMCHMAAFNIMSGLNVLYITMEMGEEEIGRRIDANLLDVPINDVPYMQKTNFDNKILQYKEKGRLVIKQYPTAGAGANNFRYLLSELKIKKNFVPDIVYIDYLNICMSSRLKMGSNLGSYNYIKSIAEEVRGLAVEYNVPIVSATQVNRTGFTNSDMGLEHTSESFALPATADLMFALISSDELEELGQILIKQLKNRYNDVNFHKKFVVGIDRAKMRLYNVEQSAQDDVIDSASFSDDSGSMKDKFKDFL